MTIEQLNEAKKIAQAIEFCEEQIQALNTTQGEYYTPRETIYRIDNLTKDVRVPAEIMRVVGKIILAEYNQKLIMLKKDLEAI